MPRALVAKALAEAAARFPDIDPPDLKLDVLSPADRRLALAIYRAAMQHWLTLEHLIDRHLRKSMRKLEPSLRGVLLSGAAQLVFLDRLPPHAVVNESVKLARSLVRHGAGGMVNAVLRRLAGDRDVLLPDLSDALAYLSITTSHPRPLVKRWIDEHGLKDAQCICRQGVRNPPIWIQGGDEPLLWQGAYEEMSQLFADNPHLRVQDPTAARAVAATASLDVRTILDYCAGKGTKTRQAATLHAKATVYAHDVDEDRLNDLREASRPFENIRVGLPESPVDLLVLDVPCSNTGVLARRPEARYRFSNKRLHALVALQREIAEGALPHVRSGGSVLYSTCSIEREENRRQARWLCERTGGELVDERFTLPGGEGGDWRDGGYHALVRLPDV